MKYIDKKERLNFYVGLSGQNIVYSFIGAGFFTYFMTDIALFPAAVVSVLLMPGPPFQSLFHIWHALPGTVRKRSHGRFRR